MSNQNKILGWKFHSLTNADDLVDLLVEIFEQDYPNSGFHFRPLIAEVVFLHAGKKFVRNHYKTFSIPKKSGGCRTIHAPNKKLKFVLKLLNKALQYAFVPHPAATGFVPGKSIIDNAALHTKQRYVYNIDLKDFFHSFDYEQVNRGLRKAFPQLFASRGWDIPHIIASLCTHRIETDKCRRVVLPQGAPTSPTITNILCYKLDRRLTGLGKRFGATYSRYADDITFSSIHNLYRKKAFQNELNRIIRNNGNLIINPKKTRLQKVGYRQEVTGLIVNEKINVRRKYIKEIRMWLYYWERYGLSKAATIYDDIYAKNNDYPYKKDHSLDCVLKGKLNFLRMVKGVSDPTYQKLLKKFIRLHETSKSEVLNCLSKDNPPIGKSQTNFPTYHLDLLDDIYWKEATFDYLTGRRLRNYTDFDGTIDDFLN